MLKQRNTNLFFNIQYQTHKLLYSKSKILINLFIFLFIYLSFYGTTILFCMNNDPALSIAESKTELADTKEQLNQVLRHLNVLQQNLEHLFEEKQELEFALKEEQDKLQVVTETANQFKSEIDTRLETTIRERTERLSSVIVDSINRVPRRGISSSGAVTLIEKYIPSDYETYISRRGLELDPESQGFFNHESKTVTREIPVRTHNNSRVFGDRIDHPFLSNLGNLVRSNIEEKASFIQQLEEENIRLLETQSTALNEANTLARRVDDYESKYKAWERKYWELKLDRDLIKNDRDYNSQMFLADTKTPEPSDTKSKTVKYLLKKEFK